MRLSSGGCVDVDECSTGLASCAPPSVATCVNTSGGYFCSCVDGYEGDGRQCVASPCTAEAEISIAMDYHKTIAAAGGKEMLKEALIDAILQVSWDHILVTAWVPWNLSDHSRH